MSKHSLHNDIKVVQHLSCAAYTATQTPSNGIDTQGFESLEFIISHGTMANAAASPQPSWTFKLQESDSQSSGFTDVVTATDVVVNSAKSPVTTPNASTGVFLTVDAAAEDDATYRISYIGAKRYVRVVATAADTPGATPLAINAVLGHANIRPTDDDA